MSFGMTTRGLKRRRSPNGPAASALSTYTPTTPTKASSPELTERPSSPQKSKKLKLLETHAQISPFPQFTRPTPEEASQVHALLASAHPGFLSSSPSVTRAGPVESNDAAGTCGNVPNVLESLIGTILSQNTSARNSTAAKRGLDAAFGRNAFAKIAAADKAEVVEAIKTGGLANKKAGVIQSLLREVKRRHGLYSLQHLAAGSTQDGVKGNGKARSAGVPDEEAMRELVSYDGVGPKTASCVLLFCLGRASFPVDTHVFRLSKVLGWVPERADRVSAQAHLELRVPEEFKYGLHVLMVGHGRRCKGCKGDKGKVKGECILKKWVSDREGVKGEHTEKILDAEEKSGVV